MNQLTRAASTALSADLLARLESGYEASLASTTISSGKPILRMLKTGVWVYGQANDEVQDGSEWAVNPLAICHGWSCWTDRPGNQKNELLGESMAAVTEPKPPQPAPLQGFPFKEQWTVDLRCVLGDDEGTEVVYKTGSDGGKRAASKLMGAVVAQVRKDPSHIVPVVQLLSDSYPHTKYGQTFVPIIEIIDWADMDGNRAAAAPAAVEEQRPEAAPTTPSATARPAGAPRRQRPAVARA